MAFDDMIANMKVNRKQCSIVTELFLRDRKLNISIIFVSQSYFKVPKTKRDALFYHENIWQIRTSKDSIKLFV